MTPRIVILSAGGHAQVVADILLAMMDGTPSCSIVGFLDDDTAKWGQRVLGFPVLGPVNLLPQLDHDAAIVAIGDNKTRAQLTTTLMASGERLFSAIHPRATLARAVEIGPGTMIAAGVVINTGAEVDAGAIINSGAVIEHHCRVASFAHVAPRACLGGGVVLGEGALIGLGAVILPRRRIGDWAIVGAGATVVDDVPAGWKVAGIPARRLARRRSS